MGKLYLKVCRKHLNQGTKKSWRLPYKPCHLLKPNTICNVALIVGYGMHKLGKVNYPMWFVGVLLIRIVRLFHPVSFIPVDFPSLENQATTQTSQENPNVKDARAVAN